MAQRLDVRRGWEHGITPNWIVGLEYDDAGVERSYQLAGNARGICTFDARQA
jgi:outer membrane immunogenic protein